MQLVAYMKLKYMGMGEHQLISASKVDSLYRLTKSENKALAEWALNRFNFHRDMGNSAISVEAQPLYAYLNKLHRDYESDLRKNYFEEPEIADDEAIDMIYHDAIEKELEKIQEKETITIKCG